LEHPQNNYTSFVLLGFFSFKQWRMLSFLLIKNKDTTSETSNITLILHIAKLKPLEFPHICNQLPLNYLHAAEPFMFL